jgi:hypothetical protein
MGNYLVHGLVIPMGQLEALAPRSLSRVVNESLSDDVGYIGRRRNLPLNAKWFSKGDVGTKTLAPRIQRLRHYHRSSTASRCASKTRHGVP